MNIDHTLAELATRRRVFHSEADLQFAFAWRLKELHPGVEIRLETHPEPAVRLDLLAFEPTTGHRIAVELKYLTRLWSGSDAGEAFHLKNHGASDVRCYDVVKDIARVERFVSREPLMAGYVIALTNDPTYWRPPTHGRQTNADAFRIAEGYALHGDRRWGPRTGPGTSKGRTAPISLQGTYRLHWRDYSQLDNSPAGTFRALVVKVDEHRPRHATVPPLNRDNGRLR